MKLQDVWRSHAKSGINTAGELESVGVPISFQLGFHFSLLTTYCRIRRL